MTEPAGLLLWKQARKRSGRAVGKKVDFFSAYAMSVEDVFFRGVSRDYPDHMLPENRFRGTGAIAAIRLRL